MDNYNYLPESDSEREVPGFRPRNASGQCSLYEQEMSNNGAELANVPKFLNTTTINLRGVFQISGQSPQYVGSSEFNAFEAKVSMYPPPQPRKEAPILIDLTLDEDQEEQKVSPLALVRQDVNYWSIAPKPTRRDQNTTMENNQMKDLLLLEKKITNSLVDLKILDKKYLRTDAWVLNNENVTFFLTKGIKLLNKRLTGPDRKAVLQNPITIEGVSANHDYNRFVRCYLDKMTERGQRIPLIQRLVRIIKMVSKLGHLDLFESEMYDEAITMYRYIVNVQCARVADALKKLLGQSHLKRPDLNQGITQKANETSTSVVVEERPTALPMANDDRFTFMPLMDKSGLDNKQFLENFKKKFQSWQATNKSTTGSEQGEDDIPTRPVTPVPMDVDDDRPAAYEPTEEWAKLNRPSYSWSEKTGHPASSSPPLSLHVKHPPSYSDPMPE